MSNIQSSNLIPSKYLTDLISKSVFIKLNTNESLKGNLLMYLFLGTLLSVDSSMNMVLTDAFQLKLDGTHIKHDYSFIRGNNGISHLFIIVQYLKSVN